MVQRAQGGCRGFRNALLSRERFREVERAGRTADRAALDCTLAAHTRLRPASLGLKGLVSGYKISFPTEVKDLKNDSNTHVG